MFSEAMLRLFLACALIATPSSPVPIYEYASSTFLDWPGSKPSVFLAVSGVKQLACGLTSGVLPAGQW